MSFAEYITKPGDRWDLIANKAYGTIGDVTLEDGTKENAMSYIIRSNPGFQIDSVLTEGLLLQIPFIPKSGIKTDTSLYPPWKD